MRSVRIVISTRRIAILVGAAVFVLGAVALKLHAAGFFVASETESGTLSGNASLIADNAASGGKAVQFNAPPASGGGGGGTGGGTPSRPEPFPATMKPDATNTGIVPGTALTVVSGNQTYGPSSNGQTISGKDFHGYIRVTGANITFENCIFRGGTPNGNNALLDTEDSTGTITVKDSEFVPANPAATIDGLWTRNTTIYRANIHGSVDGMKGDSNTLVQDSYIHDMKWFASDPNQGGGETHNDGVQTFAGESHITLRHNNIDLSTVLDNKGQLASNAALQTSGAYTTVEGNWLDGGGCTLNFAAQPLNGATLSNISITNNRFGRYRGFTDCVVLISNKTVVSQYTGNIWDNTGKAVPAPQQHD